MYLVVSYWEPLPGKEREMEEQGIKVLSALRRTPGVVFSEGIKSEEGKHVIVHAYESEEAYRRVQEDADNEFARAYRDNRVEERSRWLHSERGEAFPHA